MPGLGAEQDCADGPSCASMPTMIRIHVHFPKLVIAKLRKLSMLSGMPVAEIVRRAVNEYLAKHGA